MNHFTTIGQKFGKALKIGAAGLLFASTSANAAVNGDSFDDLKQVFTDLLGGSFGLLLAILGFAGTFFIYMWTHRGSVLITGFFISIIAGGITAIAETAFNIGKSSLSTH